MTHIRRIGEAPDRKAPRGPASGRKLRKTHRPRLKRLTEKYLFTLTAGLPFVVFLVLSCIHFLPFWVETPQTKILKYDGTKSFRSAPDIANFIDPALQERFVVGQSRVVRYGFLWTSGASQKEVGLGDTRGKELTVTFLRAGWGPLLFRWPYIVAIQDGQTTILSRGQTQADLQHYRLRFLFIGMMLTVLGFACDLWRVRNRWLTGASS